MKIDLREYATIQEEALKQLQKSDNSINEFLNRLLNLKND